MVKIDKETASCNIQDWNIFSSSNVCIIGCFAVLLLILQAPNPSDLAGDIAQGIIQVLSAVMGALLMKRQIEKQAAVEVKNSGPTNVSPAPVEAGQEPPKSGE